MSVQNIIAVFSAIVVVAGITTIVTSANSAAIIQAIGSMFSGSLRAAMGR